VKAHLIAKPGGSPTQRDRSCLGEDRRQILEGPLLADPSDLLLYGEWGDASADDWKDARSCGSPTPASRISGWRVLPSARVELEATGENARRRSVDALAQLTPQEAQASRLTAQGLSNRGIAAQLFMSPSTVEYHLRKAFSKLGVSHARGLLAECHSGSRLARRVTVCAGERGG
jgi:DNA-binding CsgD family transcriptional regulator